MILQRPRKTRTFVILFLTVSFSISLLFYGRTLIQDLKDLSESEIALFTESQIMDQHFSEFQRALGFGGYIHNVKEYLLHRKQSQLTLMKLNIEEIESSYASLREFFHDEESMQALQTIDNFLRVTRESYEVILLPENQMLESTALDSLLMLENPEILSALITLETFKENYNRRATRDIQSSIDEIVSDLLFASILLPIALLIGIYLTYLLKRSYKTSLELKKNKKEIEAKSKGWETQLEKSEKQRIANLVILGDLNETTKTLRLEIDERKQAEQALKESEEHLRIITNNLPILISQIDKDLKYTYANQYYYDIGELQDSMIGKNVVDVIGKETFNTSYPNMQKALSGERVSFENRYLNKKNNKLLIMESHFIPYVVNDQVESFFVLAMDITERKLAEEALSESEAKLSALFSSMTEIVVMHELVLNPAGKAIDYRIIDCNTVFTEVTGILKEDAIGHLASELYQTDPPPYLEIYAKVALGGDSHEFTTYYPPLDKHLMISVVSPQTGKFATIATDISDMMQIQDLIMAKNKEMENYLYITSHDLRTPLVNIQGFSQRLKKQADSIKNLFADKTIEPEIRHQLANITDEDIPKTLNFIFTSIEKMDTLINGLLQLSRTGRMDMNIQKNDMNQLFAKILDGLDFQIKETACKIHVNSLPECYGDAALLDQLFTNIISNALKYYDVDRPLKITVDAKKNFNKLVYTIKDTGKGIAPKHLDKIWDIFYRVDPKSDKAGEGIGLSLVKQIVEKHKGKIWVESEKNKGSVFHIELHNGTFTEIKYI